MRAFLSHAPIALMVLMLLIATLLDFCSDLWRIANGSRYEARFFCAILYGLRMRPILESLLRLDRASRWRMLFPRYEWLFVPLWLCAAAWINFVASLPLILGSVFATLLLFSGAMILRIEVESRERGIADGALRFVGSILQARTLGRLPAFVSRGVERHHRARSCEHKLAIASAVILLLVRLCAVATLVTTLLYGLTLVGLNEAQLGEIVALLLLLRSLFALLEQQAWQLAFYAPDPKINYRAPTEQNIKFGRSSAMLGKKLGQQRQGSYDKVLEASQGLLHLPSSDITQLNIEGLTLARGEIVALTGDGASGKSLFLKACVGLYPSEGLRFLDEIVEINDTERLAALIGYVPQEVSLIEGTIAENITSFRYPFDNALLVDILAKLDAHKLLATLPDGLATRVEPFDNSLPYGFKVQILIAAALYNKPRLLLLDASVASLDAKSFASLSQIITSLKQRGVSTIMVTRQPNLLKICDQTWLCAQQKLRPILLT